MLGEEVSRACLEYIFDTKFLKFRDSSWLKSPKGHSVELDGYCQDLKLAFEYNGVQHYKFVQRFHFIMHGSHHLYPKDTERLLMPPVPGLLMATMLFAFFYVIFTLIGYPNYTWGFFPGFFLGYLLYSFLHRATHVVKPPKQFKFLWKHHSLHHYKYPNKAFGVSNTLWDHVFGTMPPKKS